MRRVNPMRALRFTALLPLVLASFGCEAQIDGHPASQGGGSAPGVGGNPSEPAEVPTGTTQQALLPARIRRLSNAEYENSARALVPAAPVMSAGFAPDTRQGGYTLNDAQRVDSVLAKQIASAASALAALVRKDLNNYAPCSDAKNGGDACAQTFAQSFATRAFRRPVGEDEVAKLVALYHVGADGAEYADGIELVATGVLQSAGFLYLTETGNAAQASVIKLTPYETASAMSYLISASPPSDALLAAAKNGQLETSEGRQSALASLLQAPGARERLTRVVSEWLGTDKLADTAKDSVKYPEYAARKSAMVAETSDFLQELTHNSTGTVGELLGASWTTTGDPELARLYGASGSGRVQLPTRRGILNQGAFLSVYAHASETAPVLRGVALLRRVTCIGVPPPPPTLNIAPVAQDNTRTMRERLNAHVTGDCVSCHKSIDNFGFAFERYDGMGKEQTLDNNKPIDSHVVIATGHDVDGEYADSNALAVALSKSAEVRECFARNIFRASAGRSDSAVAASEDDFVKYWKALPSAAAGGILDTVQAYVTSPAFNVRRAQ